MMTHTFSVDRRDCVALGVGAGNPRDIGGFAGMAARLQAGGSCLPWATPMCP